MNAPFILAWEVTKVCNLNCLHCRASAVKKKDPSELSTKDGYRLLEDLAKLGTKMVILAGGEPLMREDIFDLAAYGSSLGLRMTLATNGSLIDDLIAEKIKNSGIVRVSVSLDGVTANIHDEFRGMPGAFSMAIRGIDILRSHNIAFQINTTVAAMNVHQMASFPGFVRNLGAKAWHVFFLVPTGRGHTLALATIEEYRNMLEQFYLVYKTKDIECKATCAPQFYRLIKEKGEQPKTKGCLAGTGFGFVSSTGVVQPCGFLQIHCGNILDRPFGEIWKNSDVLRSLRDTERLKGRCKTCNYKNICGGCRARAYEMLGDIMEVDPICWYENG